MSAMSSKAQVRNARRARARAQKRERESQTSPYANAMSAMEVPQSKGSSGGTYANDGEPFTLNILAMSGEVLATVQVHDSYTLDDLAGVVKGPGKFVGKEPLTRNCTLVDAGVGKHSGYALTWVPELLSLRYELLAGIGHTICELAIHGEQVTLFRDDAYMGQGGDIFLARGKLMSSHGDRHSLHFTEFEHPEGHPDRHAMLPGVEGGLHATLEPVGRQTSGALAWTADSYMLRMGKCFKFSFGELELSVVEPETLESFDFDFDVAKVSIRKNDTSGYLLPAWFQGCWPPDMS